MTAGGGRQVGEEDEAGGGRGRHNWEGPMGEVGLVPDKP